jgi:mevalonate kinase
MTSASAPGKIILFGDHAVVYGKPAIAIPVRQVMATVSITAYEGGEPGTIKIEAPDIQLDCLLTDLGRDHPLTRIISLTLDEIQVKDPPSIRIRIESNIPISAGMGSGAAVSIAVVQALSTHLEKPLTQEQHSALAFEAEKIHHGSPSGIDNTVIAYNQPVYFTRSEGPSTFPIGAPFTLLIGDTGVVSPTSVAVGQVKETWRNDPERLEALFDEIGQIATEARVHLMQGEVEKLGPLMTRNQKCLESIGVSSPELNNLLEAAISAGAMGAKLSGAGLGGNMIALVTSSEIEKVQSALLEVGARNVLVTEVAP